MGLIPGLGILKNADEVVTLLKNALPQLMPYADEMAAVLRQVFQNGSPALGALAGGTRYVDDLAEAGQTARRADNLAEGAEAARATQQLAETGAETAREAEAVINMRPGVNKPEEFSLNPQSALDEAWHRKYNAAKEYYAQAAANSGTADTVTYYRVQGGTNGNQRSKERILINNDGTITIDNKGEFLNVSAYDMEHALYYQANNRPGGNIIAFDVPRWFDDFVRQEAILQDFYRSSPLNQGGNVPKMPDLSKDGFTFDLPLIWNEWLEEYAFNARIIPSGGG